MNLNLLRPFVIVAEAASFSDAARRLRLPRSSISRAVADLERELGVALFNRTTRRVALTTAGEAVYARVAPQLAALERSLGTLPERDEKPSGHLRLTAPTDMGVTFIPALLAGFSLRYPAVSLEVNLSARLVDLVGEGFDFALRTVGGRLADSSLVARRLSEVAMELYAAPAYLARGGTPRAIEETAEHDWVLLRGRPPERPFPKLARPARVTGDDMLFIHQAVRAGAGLGLLPSFLAKPDLASGHLVRVLPRLALRTGTLYFVHPKSTTSTQVPKKVAAFRDYAIEFIAANPLTSRSA